MANRSYLYSVNKIPTETGVLPPKGISEWRSEVPFLYQVLMSENPQLCPSKLGNSLESDDPDDPTQLWALYAPRKPGHARLKKFLEILKVLPEIPKPLDKPEETITIAELRARVEQSEEFLKNVTYPYLLLEVVELLLLIYTPGYGADFLQTETEAIASECISAGQAIDDLPADPVAAANILIDAVANKQQGSLRVFYGLRFDDYIGSYNSTGLGLYWSNNLFFSFG